MCTIRVVFGFIFTLFMLGTAAYILVITQLYDIAVSATVIGLIIAIMQVLGGISIGVWSWAKIECLEPASL